MGAVKALLARFEECLPPALLEPSDGFRRKHLYQTDVDKVLRRHDAPLRALHKSYAQPKPGATAIALLSAFEWLALLSDGGQLDDDDGEFGPAGARVAFQRSLMNVADQSGRRKLQTVTLTYTDFLEALVRVAMAKRWPSDFDIDEAGHDSLLGYLRERGGGPVVLPAAQKAGEESAGVCAEKLLSLLLDAHARREPGAPQGALLKAAAAAGGRRASRFS